MLIHPLRWLATSITLAVIGTMLGALLGLALALAGFWTLAGDLSDSVARRRGIG